MLSIISKEYWESYCSTLTSATKLGSVWKMARKMSGTETKQSIPNLVKDGLSYETNIEKANLLASTYAATSSNENRRPAFMAHKKEMEEMWCNKSTNEKDE